MKYEKVVKASFIERKNRFVAVVDVETDPGTWERVSVHVKNTGRCKELLVPGARVYLEDFEGRMGSRKMRYSLIGVEKEILREGKKDILLINMDSQAPNKVVQEALASGKLKLPGFAEGGGDHSGAPRLLIKPETTYGNSRFDFYLEEESEGGEERENRRRAFVEVKGVTLEEDGFARFPDAPTQRGVKHIKELCKAVEDGHEAFVLFVIQMKGMHTFGPNDDTHPEFGKALAEAAAKGVRIMAVDCIVTPDTLELDQKVPIQLSQAAKASEI